MSIEVPLSEQEKILRLRTGVREAFPSPQFIAFYHGTDVAVAQKILEQGLLAPTKHLASTALNVFDPSKSYEDQDDSAFQKMLAWPHRGYKGLVVIMIPKPAEGEGAGSEYVNSIFEELPQEKKINLGVQGVDRSYVIPPQFIKGYIDAENFTFVENPSFHPQEKIQIKKKIGGPTDHHIASGEPRVVMPPAPDDTDIF